MPKNTGDNQAENKGPQIDIRSRPTQARSRETFDKILLTAAELLDEVGYEGFNTNILAERTGVRVSAVYRYFPNKLSVICTLADQMVAEWDGWMEDFGDAVEEAGEWDAVWSRYIDRFVSSIKQLPGGLAIRRAMKAAPELQQIDQEDNKRLAERLADSLTRYCPTLPKAEARIAAILLMETTVPVLDMALESSPRKANQLIAGIKTMHFTYFDHLFEQKRHTASQEKSKQGQQRTRKQRE